MISCIAPSSPPVSGRRHSDAFKVSQIRKGRSLTSESSRHALSVSPATCFFRVFSIRPRRLHPSLRPSLVFPTPTPTPTFSRPLAQACPLTAPLPTPCVEGAATKTVLSSVPSRAMPPDSWPTRRTSDHQGEHPGASR